MCWVPIFPRVARASSACPPPSLTKDRPNESRIRPTLHPGSVVTDTRANTDYLVTEYGVARLKGLTAWERAEALINIAHPDFREQLIADAEKMGLWRKSSKR